jgi:hypothetical protein
MIEVYRADMLGFFEEMAAETAGWKGVKTWGSEFAEMCTGVLGTARGSPILAKALTRRLARHGPAEAVP